jgi:hypothetical protein
MTQPNPTNRRPTRTHWTQAQAQAALEDLAQSGLSAQAFAEREGFSVQRLGYWKKRLREQTMTAQAPNALIAVSLPQTSSVEITFKSIVVRIPSHLDPRHIAQIVAALACEGVSC